MELNQLKSILQDIKGLLENFSEQELTDFAEVWEQVVTYTSNENAEATLFIFLLKTAVSKVAILKINGFDKVLNDIPRFKPQQPASLPQQPKGLPPVHVDVIEIEKKIRELRDKNKE